MNGRTVDADRFEQAALLHALGFQYAGAEPGDRGRVVLRFLDPKGEGERTLARHSSGGIEVNSLRFEEGLGLAKARVFSAKRGGPNHG